MPINEHNPIKLLDNILDLLLAEHKLFRSKSFIKDVRQGLIDKHSIVLMESDMLILIKKLIDDGYVVYIEEDYNYANKTIVLTFNGVVFCSLGGYETDRKNQLSENTRMEILENHQKNHLSWMTTLTSIIAFFGLLSVIYYYLDLASRLHWYPFRCH